MATSSPPFGRGQLHLIDRAVLYHIKRALSGISEVEIYILFRYLLVKG